MQQAAVNNTNRNEKIKSPLMRLLDGIHLTENLIDEYNSQRENIRFRIAQAGIKYEDGKYILPERHNPEAERILYEAERIEGLIARSTLKLVGKQRLATNLISRMNDYRLKLIIIKRYIDHKPVDTIAIEMGYSPRHTQRMLKEATDMLEEIYEAYRKKKELS